ncbi:hypothetical protein C8K36_1124 [Rhodococcus sp. OK519]|uniref:hypothetical protein n=1 Tax=Rhodococcus sp. OK519 TaxID=2135729 RepID=UPI000D3D0C21|nr:hypothetical protein C8K36_1124 [Rhodococcus sp. OK519]
MTGRIFVIDRVVTEPGRAREFVASYTSEYVPGGRARGMTLAHILVSPPIWLDDDSNTVTATWTVDNVAAWWDMTRMGRPDPTLGEWWNRVDELIVERSRSMAAPTEDVEVLCNV